MLTLLALLTTYIAYTAYTLAYMLHVPSCALKKVPDKINEEQGHLQIVLNGSGWWLHLGNY